MKKQTDYYIGLDVGTDSIGWAVTDTEYNLLKFKGNAQWGIRLLDESKTAEERRAFRSSRRRTQRNKFRIQCLEMLFNEEIAKKDIAFFQRLHESNLWEDDKTVKGKYSLFNDQDFTDKEYHKLYPTIYHLRKALVENNNPVDIRLVYLAVSHIVKNRGHFLFDSDSLGNTSMPSFVDIWNDLIVYLSDEFEVSLDCQNIEAIADILKNKKMNITAKKMCLLKEFSVTKKDEPANSILTLLAGGTVNSVTLFDDEALKDSEAAKIVFSSGYDDKAAVYESVLGERFALVEQLKAVYDWALLADILNNHKYISFAKCDVYDKHKSDLKTLKAYVKAYIPGKYNLIFNENKSGVCNYPSYSGYTSKGSVEKKCSQSDFLDFLKKQLPKEPSSAEYEQMYSEIALGIFMPKIVSKDNAVIPMQVNKAELIAILNNAANYLPFLNKKDETGKTVSDKIIDIFSFRIPYYVGPLNKHSKNAWLERTSDKIYPWNFESVVDIDKSAEKFIKNLTSKCTYIYTADVLPKNSLLYSSFAVLNELNNLKIDGKEISVELKQKIYHELFEQNNKVSFARLKKYLKSYGLDGEVTGIDGDFKNSLKSYRDLGDFALSEAEKEEIIKSITIFGDDKGLLKKRLITLYGDKLSKEDINRISKLKFAGWGRLSRELLLDVQAACVETGEVDNIIKFMWNTNNNLMQLLSGNYDFNNVIKELNGDNQFTTLKQEVESLYVSPKVKRPIYQAMQIVEELVKINGCTPKKIFVEVARGAEEKKRTVSRKDRLLELYKACKKDNEELYNAIVRTDENEFRRDALYLYYTQFGKCMYTGKEIAIEEIYNKNLYDIDHIFPRSKLKDDSIDNRVLVTKKSNEDKGNIYPISQNIREERMPFWKMLLEKGLISQKKFDRLTRSTPLTDDELSSFISRQLVETRQSTKAIAQLLDKRYETEVVYVKANLVSEFRQDYGFVKCREVNDLHHAKDAYLNIVVGNVYNTRFNHSKYAFISDLQSGKVSLNRMFAYPTDKAWSVDGDNKSIDIVKKIMSKNNIRFTRYAFKQKGGLFDQNILKKGNGQVSVKSNSPLSDIDKYGGYNRATSTCFSLVSYPNEKGETVKQFIPIDLHEENKYLENPKAFIDSRYSVNCEIILPCVKYNALVSVDGFRMHISSKSGGGAQIVYKPAMQLVLDSGLESYVKKVSSYLNKCAELKAEKTITKYDGITLEQNLALYDALAQKLSKTVLAVKFSGTANAMLSKRKNFENLTLKEQCELIVQVLNIVHANVRTGDLSLLGEAKKSGTVTTGSKIAPTKNIKSFKIINQSITGLFEQEIELLD